ncbi:hypothetical protein [Bianquea renquensis]|uniref:Uncharacterized protein n=1 Tax=Bianquea renquensis TaxID=2763661 RepID=A0A926DWD5_9FIRM|nr:hypothetical protein [Bianquea renquensis]MBC8545098.1 hypothetical protein [Bianquea renquensis]
MHAGEAKSGSDQRAHEDKFLAASVKMIMPAGKRDEKCTPARRRAAATSGHTEANSPPPASK